MRGDLTPRDLTIAIALGVVMLICGAYRLTPGVTGVVHDDGIYVATARSLAEGNGYRLIDLPGAPRQTKYPILYPLMLAGVWKLWPSFPANVVAMQALTLLLGAGSVGLACLFLIRFGYTSRAVAFTAGLVSATAPATLYLSTQTLSDMPFAFFLVLGLWCGELLIRENVLRRSSQFLAGIVLSLPFLTRTVGITLIAAILALLIWHRRRWVWPVVGVACVAGPWFLWALPSIGTWGSTTVSGYYTDYSGAWAPILGPYGPTIVLQNLGIIAVQTTGVPLSGLYLLVAGPTAGGVIFVFLLTSAGAWIMAVGDAMRARPLPWVIGLYLALVSLWPWLPSRFVVPVSPFLMAYALRALSRWLPSGHGRSRVIAGGLAAAAIVVALSANAIALHKSAAKSHETGFPDLSAISEALRAEPAAPWRAYEELFAWIRENTEQTDIIAAGFDPMIFLYTDRRAIRPAVYRPEVQYGAPLPRIGTADEVLEILRRANVRYLVVLQGDADHRALEAVIEELRRRFPGALEQRFVASDPRIAAYQFQASATLVR